MTRLEFDILRLLNDNKTIDEISNELMEEKDKIEKNYNNLINKNLIMDDKLTDEAKRILEEHKIDNAIILAAGMATRFVPISYEIPKGLLPVNSVPLVERQILQLRELGINEIIIVVGYKKEAFEYLKDKYGVILVESKEYEYKNNHSSVYAARDYLKNSIITSSDLYFTKNIFQKYAYDSYYTTIYIDGPTEERGITTDEDGKITDTFYGERAKDVWVTLGYAYFSDRFSKKMIEILDKIYDDPKTFNKFWADIQDDNLNDLYMYQKKCRNDVIYEFDSLEELREFDETYKYDSNCKILRTISNLLSTTEDKLTDFEMLKEIRKTLFKFKYQNDFYLCDVDSNYIDEISYNDDIYELKTKEDGVKIYEKRIR